MTDVLSCLQSSDEWLKLSFSFKLMHHSDGRTEDTIQGQHPIKLTEILKTLHRLSILQANDWGTKTLLGLSLLQVSYRGSTVTIRPQPFACSNEGTNYTIVFHTPSVLWWKSWGKHWVATLCSLLKEVLKAHLDLSSLHCSEYGKPFESWPSELLYWRDRRQLSFQQHSEGVTVYTICLCLLQHSDWRMKAMLCLNLLYL